jgi:hypothetical protein
MPNLVTIWRAVCVTRSRSFEAPVVISSKGNPLGRPAARASSRAGP